MDVKKVTYSRVLGRSERLILREVSHRENGKLRVHFSGEFLGQVDLFVINKQLRWVNLGY